MKALTDGDIITYSVGFACEGTFYMCGDGAEFKYKKEALQYCEDVGLNPSNIQKMSSPEPIENCLHSVKIMLESILENTEATEQQIYLTGKDNFREDVATILPYKGNRSGDKPFHYENIRAYLTEKHEAIVVDGMEADDAMGIVQWKTFYSSDLSPEGHTDTIICSTDKDLDMIPGWHYNWNRQEKYFVSLDQASKAFYTQLLTGDKTDNIQGIPGIGKAKAARVLEGLVTDREMYEAVVEAYVDYYGEELSVGEVNTIIKENADLLWILREPNNRWAIPA